MLHGTKDVRPDPCCPRTAQPFLRENSMCCSSGVDVRVRSDQAFQKFEPTGFSTWRSTKVAQSIVEMVSVACKTDTSLRVSCVKIVSAS